MLLHTRDVIAPLLIILALIPSPQPAFGQVTTGGLSGRVVDEQAGVLPGADVVAEHEPTGTSYTAVTRADGVFVIQNVRVGPYTITIRMPGFAEQAQHGVFVAVGEQTAVEFRLRLEGVTETVTVMAASSVFTGSRAGTSDTVGARAIETLPTVQRSLQDFARVNPFVVQTATNANPSALSIAGRSGRYNNLQIDGAVNNDLFGLADTATPGGQASTEPISIDAIQELQIVVAPYDVRQGGFSGGGINAVTRSGTNTVRGTAYYFFRDQSWVGDGVDRRPIATFSDKQFGGSVGLPILPNRAFAFTNLEWGRRETPAGWSVDGSSGQAFGRQAEVQRVLDIARARYGYAPGGLGETIRNTNNDKVFARGDVNIRRSQLTVRHNYVDAFNDVGTPSFSRFIFADQFYRFHSQTNSTVGQLNSTIGSAFNELRMSYQRIRDFRSNSNPPFPQVNVRLGGGQDVRFGTEQFSTRNRLDQDIIELHNDFTFVRGRHTVTVGTHNELFQFQNLFIRDNFGTYDFASIDLFEQGLAQAFDHSFSATADPLQSASFWVYQLGFYAGDQWRISPRLTMTYGLRLDAPLFPDTPAANPVVEHLYSRRTDVTPESRLWSPRAGFNLDVSRGETRQQVRGGAGVFGGRTPYVWLSNQYTNTGNEFIRVNTGFNAGNRFPFVADPFAQPRTVPGFAAALNEITLVDPGYSFPRLVRGNAGYDRSLPWLGLLATAEVLFSVALAEIDYQNLNLMPAGTRPDGRLFYRRADPSFSDVIFLTNTGRGDSWSVAGKLDRPFRNRWFASASYMYGQSRTVNNGGSSQARSNWINEKMSFDVNRLALDTSNFDPGHRVNMAVSYQIPLWRANATVSAYYNGQTGRPYAYQFSNDVNVDQGTNQDLLYIPSGSDDVVVTNGTFEQLMAFVRAGDCRALPSGGIMRRNTCRAPWTNTLDIRAAFDVPFGGRYKGEVTLDLLNLLNAIDREAGLVEYALFNGLSPVSGAVDPATGRWAYTLNTIALPGGQRWQRDDLRSRWQGQLGFRLRF